MTSWTPSLAIGVSGIDAQHQALFVHAARFDAAVARREPNDQLAELFGSLARYAAEHFEAEERLRRDDLPPVLGQVSTRSDATCAGGQCS
jgi:hemerythrin-like metal-binding protein